MKNFLIKVQTAYALGIRNLWRVFWYRFSLKLGFNAICHAVDNFSFQGDFFYSPKKLRKSPLKANLQWQDQYYYFGWFKKTGTEPPKWHQNPFNLQFSAGIKKQWYEIADFDSQIGDIKTIWEASRFDWVLGFSQAAALGNQDLLIKLNQWLKDWCQYNPPYRGVNWKCGQEASIRVMHLCMAASILEQQQTPSDALVQLIKIHLKRIAATIGYAVAQDNNHGTSEAAALFIGGSFLLASDDENAISYQKIGRKWLENRAQHLIAEDGTFSQYSTNYHRVMLDTYSMVEYWRNLLNLPRFSKKLYCKLALASHWLFQMTQIATGDVPNLGANDGARLLPLTATDYRDFRPSVQLATVLFQQKCAYADSGDWDLPLYWLKLKKPTESIATATSVFFAQGGYALLRHKKIFVLFNLPQFKFRPSQADALHIDLWCDGENILRDAGTYSYNPMDKAFTHYFSAVEAHNTVQFDQHNQMPRLGRFLFASWLKAKQIMPLQEQKGRLMTACGYRDYNKNTHYRLVELFDKKLRVIDTVAGFKQKAVLRWRLKAGEWLLDQENKTISNGIHWIHLTSTVNITRFEIMEGWESRYYLQKTPLSVLEVEISKPGQLITEYHFMKVS